MKRALWVLSSHPQSPTAAWRRSSACQSKSSCFAPCLRGSRYICLCVCLFVWGMHLWHPLLWLLVTECSASCNIFMFCCLNFVFLLLLRSMSTSLRGVTPQRKQVTKNIKSKSWGGAVTVCDVTNLFSCVCAVNKQLADKERVAAALENSSLLEVVNQCLSTRTIWAANQRHRPPLSLTCHRSRFFLIGQTCLALLLTTEIYLPWYLTQSQLINGGKTKSILVFL